MSTKKTAMGISAFLVVSVATVCGGFGDQGNARAAARQGTGVEKILEQHVIEDPEGRPVEMVKRLDGREIETIYHLEDGTTLLRDGFLDHVGSFPSGRLSPELSARLVEAGPDDRVAVLVFLDTPTMHDAALAVSTGWQGEIENLTEEFARADTAARLEVSTRYDDMTTRMRHEIGESLSGACREVREDLAVWIQGRGGEVAPLTGGFPILAAKLPGYLVEELAHRPEIRFVDLNTEARAALDVSVPTIRASWFWDNGYAGGTSAFDPGVLDSGLDNTHPAFDGLVVNYHVSHYWASRDPSYNDSWTDPGDLHGHGTAVTGIVASRGGPTWEAWVGVAPGLESRLYNLKSAYRKTDGTAGLYFSDAIDNIDWGIFGSSVDDIDLLSFSYGTTTGSDDTPLARFMDSLVDDLDIPVICAAGNYGPGDETLVTPAIGYNVLCVASMNDIGTPERGDDVIAYSSSRGPTAGGRKKPDLTAPGAYIKTTNTKWETEPDFVNYSGTSFAAPHVTGAVQLLMDYYGPPTDPLKIRAVFVNTADKWGSLDWNDRYGWGYLNLENAWNRREDVFRYSVYPDGQDSDFDLFLGTFDPPRDTATLVWNRHVDYSNGGGYPETWYALNDLDLRAYNHVDGSLLDLSASGIDNVEQVLVTTDEPIEVVLRVEATDSSFSGVTYEPYGLATPPGFVFPPTLPHVQVSTISDNNLFPGEEYNVTALIGNTGGFNAVDAEVTLSTPPGHTVIEGDGTTSIDRLVSDEGNNVILEWVVRAPESDGEGNVDVDVSSDCWGEVWTGSDFRSIRVNTVSDKPRLRVSVTTDVVEISRDQAFEITATIRNEAADLEGNAEEVSVELSLPVGLEIEIGSNPATIPSLGHGEEADVEWTAVALSVIEGEQWFRVHASTQHGASTLRGTDAAYVTGESTLVEIYDFVARGVDGAVVLKWQTASELDNEGFHLWRADGAEVSYERITVELIPGDGGPLWGASYAYEDHDVEMGLTYRYMLEDIDIYGGSTFHGPVEAQVHGSPCFLGAFFSCDRDSSP